MVIRAQIGNSPDVGLLILGLGLFSGVLLLGHVVDATLIFLPVGVDHGSSVASARVTFSLHMPLFLTVAAYYVGVTGPIAADRGGVHGGAVAAVGVLVMGRVVFMDSGNLFNLVEADVVPGNVGSLRRGEAGLDSGDPLSSSVVVVNGLQLTGQLHAFLESILSSLDNLVTDRVLEAGQEELVFEKESHVFDALGLNLSLSGSGGYGASNSGHGGGLVVHEADVGNLDPAAEVVHRLVGHLFEVGEVGANRLGRILWFVRFQEFFLNLVPVIEVNRVVAERLPPDDGIFPET